MIFTKGNRLPFQVDVTCNHGRLDDFIPSFNFMVILNQYVFGFSEVSGFDGNLQYETITEGGNPDPVFASQYNINFDILTFKRGMLIRKGSLASKAIRTAFSQLTRIGNNLLRKGALIAAAALDPVATLENGPAYGFVQLFDRQYKNDLATFSFFSHGSTHWDVPSLDAKSGDFMVEEIHLCCSNLKRMSNSVEPSGIWNVFGQDEHTFYEGWDKLGITEEDMKKKDEKKSTKKDEFDKKVQEKEEKIKEYAGNMEDVDAQKEKNKEEFFVEPETEKDNRTPEQIAREAKQTRENRIKEFEKQKQELEKMRQKREQEEKKQSDEAKKIDDAKNKNYEKFEKDRDKK